MFCYLNPAKANAYTVLEAFAAGAKCGIVLPDRLLPGPAVFYGVDRVTLPIWMQVQRERRPFFYIDNGYFGSKWHGGGYYRVTANRIQHSGEGASDGKRWDALDIELHPWRRGGHARIALIVQQSPWWYEWHGLSIDLWTSLALDAAADFPVQQIRPKPTVKTLPPIEWGTIKAVLTHSSNVAIDGLIEGVPCLVDAGYSAARSLAGDWLRRTLRYPENRREVFSVLADNQWTLDEIREGLAWRMLNA